MRLEPFYRASFVTPEDWNLMLTGAQGTEVQAFLIAEGRCEGGISGRYRGANYPRMRTDGTFLPNFRGAIETDDGATILFEWHGLLRAGPSDRRELVGTITHLSDDERYRWLNDRLFVLTGQVRMRDIPEGFDVAFEVAELVWEPPD
jgi:hypothetical protein